MRFALVNGQRRTAEKGLTGICPACGGPVLAKCGEKKAHHWAHKRQCSDTWATGKETDWHLGWKNCFPEAWQERILKDVQSGEKHIADILTEHNLVLEFQHSPIDPEERRARERFYSQDGRRMVWVVDCTQHQRDLKRCWSYVENYYINIFRPSIVSFPDEFFPLKWIPISYVPVVLDTGWLINVYDKNGVCYCAMPCLFIFKFENEYYLGCKLFLKDEFIKLGCVCKPSSRNRVTTGKCATMTSLKTSGSGLSPYCQQKVLLVEGDRLVTSETFSMLYIGCCEPDLHGELCQRNMVRGKPYIPDSGVGRKEDIWLLSLSFLPYRLTWTTS